MKTLFDRVHAPQRGRDKRKSNAELGKMSKTEHTANTSQSSKMLKLSMFSDKNMTVYLP